MGGLEYILGGAAALVGLLWVLLGKTKKQGAAEAKAVAAEEKVEIQRKIDEVQVKQAEEQVKQVEQVNEIHDKLSADPDYAKRVRDRFSRD